MEKYIKETFDYICKDVRNYGKGIMWAVVLIIAHFVILSTYIASLCPLVWIAGYPCPACGLTRAGICLLRGQYERALELHPFIYVILAFGMAVVVYRYRFHGKSVKWMQVLLVIMIVAMILYYVYRFLNCFPNQQPMVYNPNNLVNLTKLLARSLGYNF